MMAALTMLLLCSLPMFRRWLREKRESAARGRVFKYRRFLTPEQRHRREQVLADFAMRSCGGPPVVWLPGIGGIFRASPMMSPYLALDCIPRPRLDIGTVSSSQDEVWCFAREYFSPTEVRSVGRGVDFLGVALLVDEEDRAGLRMLCRKLDRQLARKRFELSSCTRRG